jgi:exodeoxyribonuclease VII small subunit
MEKKINFEQALDQLEKLVSELERGDVSLENSLKNYERGVKLANFCQKEIENVKQKVEMLVKKSDGSLALEDFEENEQQENVVTTKKEKVTKQKKDEGPSLFE